MGKGHPACLIQPKFICSEEARATPGESLSSKLVRWQIHLIFFLYFRKKMERTHLKLIFVMCGMVLKIGYFHKWVCFVGGGGGIFMVKTGLMFSSNLRTLSLSLYAL